MALKIFSTKRETKILFDDILDACREYVEMVTNSYDKLVDMQLQVDLAFKKHNLLSQYISFLDEGDIGLQRKCVEKQFCLEEAKEVTVIEKNHEDQDDLWNLVEDNDQIHEKYRKRRKRLEEELNIVAAPNVDPPIWPGKLNEEFGKESGAQKILRHFMSVLLKSEEDEMSLFIEQAATDLVYVNGMESALTSAHVCRFQKLYEEGCATLKYLFENDIVSKEDALIPSATTINGDDDLEDDLDANVTLINRDGTDFEDDLDLSGTRNNGYDADSEYVEDASYVYIIDGYEADSEYEEDAPYVYVIDGCGADSEEEVLKDGIWTQHYNQLKHFLFRMLGY